MGKTTASITPLQITKFQQKILQFYKDNKRPLPWRNTTNPYFILLSEFMLQQTQVLRVIDYYQTWIKKWPTIQDLSNASFPDVLSEWIGLGYNRRAKYLYTTVNTIVHEYNTDVLQAMHDYSKLPGIGKYTAQAVRIFADNEDIATVDTNIRRILIHEFTLSEDISDKDLYTIAYRCVPKEKSCIWHNALMDYGSIYLTAKKSGIKSKTKQPRFEGSDRQIRGKILKILLKEPCNNDELYHVIHAESDRVDQILDKMIEEKIIIKENNMFSIYM